MHRFPLAFIATEGPPVSRELSTVLLLEARDMLTQESESRNFKSESFEGQLRTNFQTCVLGSFSGVAFNAEVETNTGRVKARFLLEARSPGFAARVFKDIEVLVLQHPGQYN